MLIAYDALLGCNENWVDFCIRGALHGGDSDSTGAIGAAWFGVLYGFFGVPKNHFVNLEPLYANRIEIYSKKLLKFIENRFNEVGKDK